MTRNPIDTTPPVDPTLGARDFAIVQRALNLHENALPGLVRDLQERSDRHGKPELRAEANELAKTRKRTRELAALFGKAAHAADDKSRYQLFDHDGVAS